MLQCFDWYYPSDGSLWKVLDQKDKPSQTWA